MKGGTTSNTRSNARELPLVYRYLLASLAGKATTMDWSAWGSTTWQQLVEVAIDEGVSPLLCTQFDHCGWPMELPAATRLQLQTARYRDAAKNALLYKALIDVLAILGQEMPVVLLKGVALGTTLYQDRSLRPLSDIDLLIPQQHMEVAIQRLQAQGYADVGIIGGIDKEIAYHVPLQGGPNGMVMVELHWQLIAPDSDWRSPEITWFWAQTEPWQPPDAQLNIHISPALRQLTPTADVLYLAAHLGLQHGNAARLIWSYDLHLLVTQQASQIDWDVVVAQAKRFRWGAAVHAALRGTASNWDTALPSGVLKRLVTEADARATQFIHAKSVAGPSRSQDAWSKLRALSWHARLRMTWTTIFPRPDYIRWRYLAGSGAPLPLGYLLRWIDLIKEVWGSLVPRL